MRKRKYSSLPCNDRRLMEDGTPLPTVHNIVATSQILSSLPLLNLNKIHDMLPFSFYDQHKFAAITVRLHEPDCTTLLFSSGKLVVTGCRTWYECVYASLFIAELLQVDPLFFFLVPSREEMTPGNESRSASLATRSPWEHATCRTWWLTSRSPSAKDAWTCTECTHRWR